MLSTDICLLRNIWRLLCHFKIKYCQLLAEVVDLQVLRLKRNNTLKYKLCSKDSDTTYFVIKKTETFH